MGQGEVTEGSGGAGWWAHLFWASLGLEGKEGGAVRFAFIFAFSNNILMISVYLVANHVPGTVLTVLHASHHPFKQPVRYREGAATVMSIL